MPRSIASYPVFVLLAAILLLSPRAVVAGPSTSDPDQPLTLCSDQDPVAMQAECYRILAEIGKTFEMVAKAKGASQGKPLKPKEVGQVGRMHVLSLQLKRRADRLQFWREISGYTFELESRDIDQRAGAVVESLRGPLAELLKKGFPILVSRAQKGQRVLDQCAALSAAKKYEKAEVLFLPLFDDLNTMAVWYTPLELKDPMQRYFDYDNNLAGDLKTIREPQAKKGIIEARAARSADIAGFKTRLATATTSIGQQGNAVWEEKPLSGPELVTAAFAERQKLVLASAACIGLDWLHPNGPGKPNSDAMIQECGHLQADLAAALAGIVEADASRVSESEAGALYASYLQALAGWQSPNESAPLPSAVLTALEKLAAKSPQLATDVATYRRATADLLRWRARSAETRARRARQSFTASLTDVKGGDAPAFAAPLNVLVEKVLEDARSARLGLHLAVARPWMPGSGGKLTTGEFAYNCSLRDLPLTAEVSRLQADLQTAAAPPLTLEAAWATASAERGELQEVGGEVINVEIDGLIARHVCCNPADWGAVDINHIITRFIGDPSRFITYRAELKPKWLRGNYLFVQTP